MESEVSSAAGFKKIRNQQLKRKDEGRKIIKICEVILLNGRGGCYLNT